jgi:hypothetical protein
MTDESAFFLKDVVGLAVVTLIADTNGLDASVTVELYALV